MLHCNGQSELFLHIWVVHFIFLRLVILIDHIMVHNIIPRSVVVPTDDNVVRRQLRDLQEPMCYFGEGPAERRERLGKILAQLTPEARAKLSAQYDKQHPKDETQEEIFYYEGSEPLREARYKIADFSIKQCNYRLDMAKIKQLEPISYRQIQQQNIIEKIRQIEDQGSYMDEDTSTIELKTLTSCNFNFNASLLATSCRSGRCKIWSIPDMDTYLTLRGHQCNANFITFSPKSGIDLSLESANLASCAMDGCVVLWNLVDQTPICQLSGPQNWRVTRVRYHPCGSYLASCCSDNSWRLWDLTTESEILHQEGHSDAVFDIAFHPDGSLACSAGFDSYGRIWDLRTGRSIHLLEGHTKGIRTVDFSPDGYHIATGSMDNSVKIWNLRQRKLEYTIPAHVNSVTTVMFEKENGHYLVTSSFDKTIKFWSTQTWAPVKELDAFDDKVTKFDLSTKGNHLASCHFRFVKLWTVEEQF